MKKIVFAIFILFVGLSGYAQKDSVALFYSGHINAKHISKYMHKLCSEELGGRETGEKGQKLAAEYIAKEFRKSGASPGNGDSYFQYYDLNITKPAEYAFNINGVEVGWLEDYYSFYEANDQEFEGDKVLFLGYGLDNAKWNDIKEPDIKNKAVLVLDGEPKNKKGNYIISGSKRESSQIAGARAKVKNLKKHAPSVIFIVVDDIASNIKKYEHWINRSKAELPGEEDSINEPPVLFISHDVANQLLSTKATTVQKMIKAMSKKGKPISFYTKSDIYVGVKNNTKTVKVENVLASVMAKEKTDEWIVITAHYDHLGIKEEGIFYGADDNASGTSAVMMLAHTFSEMAKNGQAPNRNILFMCVSGEEKGLLGSSYYVKNPVIPLENTVCNLNIDMIGRVDEDHAGNEDYIYLIGSDKLSTELHDVSANVALTYTNLELDYKFNDPKDKNRFYYRSDHYNFAKNNIPVIFYFNGVHADYHKVTDTIDKISFVKVEKICKLIYFTAFELANRSERVTVDVKELIEED